MGGLGLLPPPVFVGVVELPLVEDASVLSEGKSAHDVNKTAARIKIAKIFVNLLIIIPLF